MSDNVDYLKSGVLYTIGNVLIKGISFVALPIFTRILSPDDFGKYNIFVSYEAIVQVILGLGISGTIKVAFFDFKKEFNHYFCSILSLTFIGTILFDIIANILIFVFNYNSGIWNAELVNLLIFSSLASAVYSLLSTKFVINADYKSNLGISLFYTISNVVVSIVLCSTIFVTEKYLGRIIGQIFPLLFIAAFVFIYYLFKYKCIINFSYWKYALKLGLPLILHMLSMVLMLQIGKIMIDYYLGSAYTGIYSIAATIAGVFSIVLGSFDNAWAPWFYRGLAGEDNINLNEGNNRLSLYFAAFTSVFILVAPEIIHIMSTSEYYDAVYSLVPLLVSTFVNFMYLFAVNQEYFYKKTSYIALGTIIATLTGIILNSVFLPWFGYIAAAYVDLICKLVLFVIHNIVVGKMHKPKVVSMKFLLLLLAGIIIVAAVTMLAYSIAWIRYTLVLFICIALVKPASKLFIKYKSDKITLK